jgi:biotin carboxyl carrier protein
VVTQENTQAQIEGLATLLVLDDEIKRLSNLREFAFFSTNETHRLINYHTAYLWEKKELLGVQLIAQSGTAEFDSHTSINLWLKEKIQFLLSSEDASKTHQFTINDIETDINMWPESLPHNLLWCPFSEKQHEPTGGLIFFREEPFLESEIKMLRWLLTSYQYTWNILIKPKTLERFHILKTKPYFKTLAIIITCVLLFPVHLSVIGTGVVVAKDPALINAPMQGTIKSFAVTPGQQVKKGQLLLTLDNTDLEATAKVNQRDYSMTAVKLRSTINEAFNDESKRTEVPVLQAQLAIDKAQFEYTQALLDKTQIRSPIDGIVIFNSTEDWIGQPVQTGERILSVADPRQLKLRIDLPITERINLKIGNGGDFFMTGQLTKIPVQLSALGYNAKMTPNRILAYEMEANFLSPSSSLQLGAQGTIKLYGNRVPLFYYLIRRPLQSMRKILGI